MTPRFVFHRVFLKQYAILFMIIYNIYIIYNHGVTCDIFQNSPSQNMTLSFVMFVILARAFLLPLGVKFAL